MTDPGIVSKAPQLAEYLGSAARTDDPDRLNDRARGVILGLAVGNLLGIPVEFSTYAELASTHPGGVREINPRESEKPMDDDLAQAVDLGFALLGGDDYIDDFADRLVKWERENGRGIGVTTEKVIAEIARGYPWPEPARIVYERKPIAPNGGIMRCAPVAIARRGDPSLLISDSASTCAVTHYAATCQWSCIITNAIIARLLNGSDPDLSAILSIARADGCPDLATIARNDRIPAEALVAVASGQPPPPDAAWLNRNHGLIGHTLLALQFALWAAKTPLDFEEALVASVSCGGDTDTNAAVAGAVLGARYGVSAIPARWLSCVPQRERIETLADGLQRLSG